MDHYTRATEIVEELERTREKGIEQAKRAGLYREKDRGDGMDRELVTIASIRSTLALVDALKEGVRNGQGRTAK